MRLIAIVGYFLLSLNAEALMPIEGILMGESDTGIQQDPLQFVFKDYYDTSSERHNAKLRVYQNFFDAGRFLAESCEKDVRSRYSNPWSEKQAQKFVTGTLQYLGIDNTIKAIGAYAKALELDEDRFKTLKQNLIGTYCSKNITLFSRKSIERAFDYYYQNPQKDLLPTFDGSPFATRALVAHSETALARSQEFDRLIDSFKSFCSWGGSVDDYRLLTTYLRNPYIMAWVFMHLRGARPVYVAATKSVLEENDPNAVQVACEDLICRRTTLKDFQRRFPMANGSFSIYKDLSRLYCHHFRFQDPSPSTLPQAKAWLKAQELEDPILESNYFISLITGVPDPYFGATNYADLLNVAKSSFQERWNAWSSEVLGNFSKDILYEESLKIAPEPRRDPHAIRYKGFKVDFSITLGEMDRITSSDKLGLSFELKITKNYFRWVRREWGRHSANMDPAGHEKLKKQVSAFLAAQIKQKEKYFRQKMWDESFADLIADELMAQLQLYDGPLFDSLQDELLTVPVRFSYGVFALGYLKYRADVNAGRLKLNL